MILPAPPPYKVEKVPPTRKVEELFFMAFPPYEVEEVPPPRKVEEVVLPAPPPHEVEKVPPPREVKELVKPPPPAYKVEEVVFTAPPPLRWRRKKICPQNNLIFAELRAAKLAISSTL